MTVAKRAAILKISSLGGYLGIYRAVSDEPIRAHGKCYPPIYLMLIIYTELTTNSNCFESQMHSVYQRVILYRKNPHKRTSGSRALRLKYVAPWGGGFDSVRQHTYGMQSYLMYVEKQCPNRTGHFPCF